jgi:hypothetical protein
MKKSLLVAATAGLVAAMLLPAMASAAPPPVGHNWGSYVNAASCAGGTPVLNITFTVTNDADSGLGGDWWALDNYQKLVQVWQGSDGSYCAVVHYAGQFTTLAGQESPGTTVSSLAGGFTGTMAGGYTATFGGYTLNPNPGYPTSGYIGSFDLQGGVKGNGASFDWVSTYFEATGNSPSFAQPTWGWVYRGGTCGTWYNTYLGTSGDITC